MLRAIFFGTLFFLSAMSAFADSHSNETVAELEEGKSLLQTVTKMGNDIVKIRNSVLSLEAVLGAPDSVRVEHKGCAGKFAEEALKQNPRLTYIGNISHADLQSGAWKDVIGFDVAYGERAFFKPIGHIKLGKDHQSAHPVDRLEFARKVNGRRGPAIPYIGNTMQIVAPPSEVATLMWRLIDYPHSDNRQQNLQFVFYAHGGIGNTAKPRDFPNACGFMK